MTIPPKYIIDKIAQAGVVGAGGAGFPTHTKLGQSVEQVIANGAECEPLLASDTTLLEHQTSQVIQGLLLVMASVQAKEAIIAIKSKHKKIAKIITENLKNFPQIKLHLLEDFYPAGDEHTLINEVTGKRVPPGRLPLSVGVVVNNVTTLWQVAAAFSGQAVISRYVTVAGEVRQPIVIDTPIGTPLTGLIAAAGYSKVSDYKVIVGGPMMGQLANDPSQEVTTKTTSGIIVVASDHWLAQRTLVNPQQQLKRVQSACDGCRMCTDLCPRFLLGHPLEPHLSVQALAQQQVDAGQYFTSALLCCLCGVCDTIACPCNLSPRALYLSLKKEFSRKKFPPQKFIARPVTSERQGRKVSLKRIMQRLNINQYAENKPTYVPSTLQPKRVWIKLQQHVGNKAVPIVKIGDRVSKGQLIGEIPAGKLGARVHASINGSISKIETDFMEISKY